MLVKAGASLNVHDINGDTPVLIAASSGFINGVEILTKVCVHLFISIMVPKSFCLFVCSSPILYISLLFQEIQNTSRPVL